MRRGLGLHRHNCSLPIRVLLGRSSGKSLGGSWDSQSSLMGGGELVRLDQGGAAMLEIMKDL